MLVDSNAWAGKSHTRALQRRQRARTDWHSHVVAVFGKPGIKIVGASGTRSCGLGIRSCGSGGVPGRLFLDEESGITNAAGEGCAAPRARTTQIQLCANHLVVFSCTYHTCKHVKKFWGKGREVELPPPPPPYLGGVKKCPITE